MWWDALGNRFSSVCGDELLRLFHTWDVPTLGDNDNLRLGRSRFGSVQLAAVMIDTGSVCQCSTLYRSAESYGHSLVVSSVRVMVCSISDIVVPETGSFAVCCPVMTILAEPVSNPDTV